MFVNEDVREIGLIVSGSTDYQFPAALSIELSTF